MTPSQAFWGVIDGGNSALLSSPMAALALRGPMLSQDGSTKWGHSSAFALDPVYFSTAISALATALPLLFSALGLERWAASGMDEAWSPKCSVSLVATNLRDG